MSMAFALVDCNNFYVSCQRVFNPALNGKPVIVLSNNDGCVVARSAEAKNIGIAMGAPYFKIRHCVQAHNVAVFSSNYALYADMSQRVMDTLSELAPDIEVYSVDEAFLRLDGLTDANGLPLKNLDTYARYMAQRIKQWTGIPVSIGIASTKTLAKIANTLAKTSIRAQGVLNLLHSPHLDTALIQTPVGKVWGIGRRAAQLLAKHDITTAYELRNAPDAWIRQHIGITGLRTASELRGIPCFPITTATANKKGLTYSRSFGEPIRSLAAFKEAIAFLVTRIAEKLRAQQSCTSFLTLFIRTHASHAAPQHSEACHMSLPVPTNATAELTRCALQGVERLFREGCAYQQAGINLTALTPANQQQTSLFSTQNTEQLHLLSEITDAVNAQMGRDTLHIATMGTKRSRTWMGKHNYPSPSYTTRWSDIPALAEPSRNVPHSLPQLGTAQ